MSTASWSLSVFVNLSSALTGVAATQLRPPIDPIGIAGQYFTTLNTNVSATTLTNLAAAFQSVSDPTQAAAAILADAVLGPVARSIMKAWLLGSWYNPSNPSQAVNVVSSQAYKESLVWKVMQSHPMGYSMFTFGYWAKEPPPRESVRPTCVHFRRATTAAN
jgi:hypothetical protein